MPSIDRKTSVEDATFSTLTAEGRQFLLTSRLVRAATILARITSRVSKKGYGLSGSEFNVMVVLGDSGPVPLTSTSIVETTAMDKTKVSRAVSALDRRGWVSRTRAKTDRRFEYLELTRDGRRYFDELMPRLEKAEAAVLEGMSSDERDGLREGLTGLDRALSGAAQMSEDWPTAPQE